ncbi:predicted protein [Naegleria gruberi]|uniref:Predicted protein n=1 Tax=Naegleria gruberi TaxID=5762 RepID=D2V784_NAEGR|nr:uncharacterized protein NAEGRDRAFT_64705 [Naegleria gruberi]EFC47213.1 predicted protein [Naegleria gruberi]|eukprot:XP_002679957.1 predicted protein [Naegleria gruberi strain NEG-M]
MSTLVGGGNSVKLVSSSSTGSLTEKQALGTKLPRSSSELRITEKTTLQPLSPLSFHDEDNEFDDNNQQTPDKKEEDKYPEFKVPESELKQTSDYLKFVGDDVDLDKETDSDQSDEELDLTSNSVGEDPRLRNVHNLPEEFFYNHEKLGKTMDRLLSIFDETLIFKTGQLIESKDNGGNHQVNIGKVIQPNIFSESRNEFAKCSKKVSFRLKEMEIILNTKINDLKQELTIAKKEKDVKALEWKERYDKLQKRWQDVISDMNSLQKEKEEIRKERDSLYGLVRLSETIPVVPHHIQMPTSVSLNAFTDEVDKTHPPISETPSLMTSKVEPATTPNRMTKTNLLSKEISPKPQRLEMLKAVSQRLLTSMADSLSSQMATIFLYNPRINELQSFCIVCKYDFNNPVLYTLVENKNLSNATQYSNNTHILIGGPKAFPKQISVPANQGIIGETFAKTTALNIFDVPTFKKHYRQIDKDTGLKTKVAISYPLITKKMNNCFGVLEIMNKTPNPDNLEEIEPYDIQDEAKMHEYSTIISDLLESEADCLPYSIFVGRRSNTPVVAKEKDDKNTDLSRINVTRVYAQNAMRVFEDLEDSRTPGSPSSPVSNLARPTNALVPKDIEEYIKKLESCWRKSVSETAQFKNAATQLEDQLNDRQGYIKNLERKVGEMEKNMEEARDKMISDFKEQKIAKQEWKIKENEMRVELDFIKKAHNTIVQEHMFRLKEESIKSLLLPVNQNESNSSKPSPPQPQQEAKRDRVELPYLDKTVNQSKRVQNNSTNSGSSRKTPVTKNERVSIDFAERNSVYYPPIFYELFSQYALPTLILNSKFRIWKYNVRFLTLIGCKTEQNEIFLSQILGMQFSDICVGIEADALPRLLQYDVLQGLGIAKLGNDNSTDAFNSNGSRSASPILNNSGFNTLDLRSDSKSPTQNLLSKKTFVRVTAYISKLGQNGQKFSTYQGGSKISASPIMDESSVGNSNTLIKGPLYSIIFTK